LRDGKSKTWRRWHKRRTSPLSDWKGRNKSRPEIALNQFTGHDWSHSSPVHQLTRNERRLDDGNKRGRERETTIRKKSRGKEKSQKLDWSENKTSWQVTRNVSRDSLAPAFLLMSCQSSLLSDGLR
jgi:hypothetical protein